MGEWMDCRLADVCASIDYGFTASASAAPIGPKFLRITDIVGSGLRWETVPYVNGDITTLDRYRLHDGDIVIARTGATTGESQFIQNPPVAVFASYLVRLSIKREVDPRYVAYWLKSASFRGYLQGVLGDKSAQPNASASTMTNAPMRLPTDRNYQSAVTSILGALDDKIDLNRRMNETLEAMVRAIFKDWFVDFGPTRAKMEGRATYLARHLWSLFPNRLNGDGKPEGWLVRSIDEIALKIGMGPFGSNIKVSTFVANGIPIVSGQHLTDTLLLDGKYNFITDAHAEKLRSSNVFRGDVIFTHAGNIGQVSYIPKTSRFARYVLSQRQFYLRCDLAKISPLFIVYFFKSLEGQHALLANTSSVGVPSISRPVTNLKAITFFCPPKPLVDHFDGVVEPMHKSIAQNQQQSKALSKIRDLLLPKLMSGKIRVKDAEKLAGAVA